MGVQISKESFLPSEHRAFQERLQRCLTALGALIDRPGWGTGPTTIGAELELVLVGSDGQPRPCNAAVVAEAGDPRVTVEMVRWDLECNLTPQPLLGRPFEAMARETRELLTWLDVVGETWDARVTPIGILPTLTTADLNEAALTDSARYRALNASLLNARGSDPFRVRINGVESLDVTSQDIGLQGANTSWQVHLRTDPRAYRSTYNAAQLATLPVLAVAGNSPLLAGRQLWDETRIALFKQSLDVRGPERRDRRTARVAFGLDWLRTGPLDLFAANVREHDPLLPVLSEEDPLDALAAGRIPELAERRLHQSTTWPWNRAVYDHHGGGHLRVELRALPAGPTVEDMLANSAFLLGLVIELREVADDLIDCMPFGVARRGFYQAARLGMDAALPWVDLATGEPLVLPAVDLAARLLPVARRGLERAGVAADEAQRLLAVIDDRVAAGRTGARWQRSALESLARTHTRDEALAALTLRYLDLSSGGAPVHTWPVPA